MSHLFFLLFERQTLMIVVVLQDQCNLLVKGEKLYQHSNNNT